MEHPLKKFRYCPVCGSEKFIESKDLSKLCHQCGFHYYLNSVSAVACFVINGKNELLLCRRAHEPQKGFWDLPGGFVDIGETAEEAVEREIMEELNLKINKMSYLFSVPNQYLYSDFTVRTLDMFFRVEAENLESLKCKDDVSEAQFLPFNEIKIEEIGLSSIKIAVKKFIAGI
jgi:mutator protein MutT